MSKIVHVKAELPWVSREICMERMGRAMKSTESLSMLSLRAGGEEKIDIWAGNGTVRLAEVSEKEGKISLRYASENGWIMRNLMNEMILETVREKALRHQYRVTVSREREKIAVLLER